MLDASLRRPRLAPSARRVPASGHPAGEAAKRRAAQTPRAAHVSELCIKAELMFNEAVRVLRFLMDSGARSRNVLLGLAHDETIAGMLAQGMLRKVGSKRGTKYGYGSLQRLPSAERERICRALRKPPLKASP